MSWVPQSRVFNTELVNALQHQQGTGPHCSDKVIVGEMLLDLKCLKGRVNPPLASATNHLHLPSWAVLGKGGIPFMEREMFPSAEARCAHAKCFRGLKVKDHSPLARRASLAISQCRMWDTVTWNDID